MLILGLIVCGEADALFVRDCAGQTVLVADITSTGTGYKLQHIRGPKPEWSERCLYLARRTPRNHGSRAGSPCHSGDSVQTASRIAFVGCPEDGQAGPVAPPKRGPIRARIAPRLAWRLAYYKAAQGYGVLAPKGWHCRGWYGSSGAYLVVTPRKLRPPYFPPPKLSGPVVFAGIELGDTSGRFDVAVSAARLFPKVARKFIASVKAEGLMSDRQFDVKPFPSDAIHYLSDRAVEFMTPAEHDGLGTTGGWLMASALPIRGIVALALPPREPAQIEIMTRLPAGRSELTESILGWESRWILRDEESRTAGK